MGQRHDAGQQTQIESTRPFALSLSRRRLGGGEERPNRPPGKIALTRGLRRLLDDRALSVLLTDEQRRHGLPPRIAQMLGWPEQP